MHDLKELVQFIINGAISGSLLALLGVSFALIISVTGRFHVAYVATLVGAVYITFGLTVDAKLPIALGVIGGLIGAGIMGLGFEWGIYRHIARRAARRGANPLIPIFVASLGIVVFVQNGITLIWGSANLPLELFSTKGLHIGFVHFTSLDVVIAGVSLLIVAGLAIFLKRLRIGRFVSAVRDNPEMAAVVGIRPGMIFAVVFIIGSVIAGAIGLLQAAQAAASPLMGFQSILDAFVVAFVAGTTSSPWRLLAVGIGIAEIESVSGFWLSSQWAPTVLFGIVFVFLSLRELRIQRRLALRRLRRDASVGVGPLEPIGLASGVNS